MSSIFAKYLPSSVAVMTFADPVLGKFAKAMASGQIHDNILLHGGPGCGKSYLSTRIVLDRYPTTKLSLVTYEGANWDAETLKSVSGMINFEKQEGISEHYTIINEVDKLSVARLDELQAFMDENVTMKFITTCNVPQRLSPAFINRVKPRLMEMMPSSSVVPIIVQIMQNFGYSISTSEAQQLVAACKGSWRSLETLVIQQIL